MGSVEFTSGRGPDIQAGMSAMRGEELSFASRDLKNLDGTKPKKLDISAVIISSGQNPDIRITHVLDEESDYRVGQIVTLEFFDDDLNVAAFIDANHAEVENPVSIGYSSDSSTQNILLTRNLSLRKMEEE